MILFGIQGTSSLIWAALRLDASYKVDEDNELSKEVVGGLQLYGLPHQFPFSFTAEANNGGVVTPMTPPPPVI